MNRSDFRDLNYDWHAEMKRRMRHHRNRVLCDWVRENRIAIAIAVALVLGFFAFLVCARINQPRLERAAYLEGRYGLDRETALAMADAGEGRTAEEVIEDAVRAARGPYRVEAL